MKKKKAIATDFADRADRDAARRDLTRSLTVEAGAGTGKTTLLVDRIISLLLSRRASLEQIVAITFTEKAAGDLKIRLREALEKAVLQSREDEGEAWQQAVGDLERAPISTIHSFCASLLRERPVEARIDPNFEPMDEMGLEMLFQEVWELWLGQELWKKSAPLRRALSLSMSLADLASMVGQLYDNRDLIPKGPLPRPFYSTEAFVQNFQKGIKEALTLARDCRKEGDKGFQNIQALKEIVPEIEEASPERREILILNELVIKSAGNKQNWKPPASCEAQKQIFDDLAGELEELKRSIRAETMADLVEWLRGFLKAIEEEKAKHGVLDFQDLLLLARNLLRDNKEVRRYFQEKFLYILIDEFQDTDPLQVEVVFFLAEDGARAGTWEEVEVSPGKLFLVGDPKQSIYRFRRADIETYEKAREQLTKKGGSLTIRQNFRTVPSIISWVNQVFEPLIQPSDQGYFQPAYIPLIAHEERKESIKNQPGVILLAPPPDFDPEEALAPFVRQKEARSIAALIEEMVGGKNKNQWLIYDKKGKDSRPVCFRDIALLFPALSGVEIYEEALKERGIPFRLEGGKEFYLRQEVRNLLCCLRVLDDPADEISLVAALRSPFFGFSDEEIFLFVSSGNRLHYLQGLKEKESAFSDAFSLLRKLHEKRNAVPISSTVSALLCKTKALEFSLTRHGGEQMAANLRKIIDQARAFEKERSATFRRFVEWLGSREEEGLREGESPWSEEGEENVKLLTVHKAKGLEFPVVILANLAAERNRKQQFIPQRLQGRFELAIGDFKTEGYDSAWEQEKAKMEAEDRRLFYVAATRARDYLAIPLFWGKRKGFFKMLEGHFPDGGKMKPGSQVNGQLILGGEIFDLDPGEKPPLRLELAEAPEDNAAPLQRRIQWQKTLAEVKEKASRGLSLATPSSFADRADFSRYSWDEVPGSSSEPGGGAAFGSAFHEVMERVDLIAGRNLKALAQIKANEQSLPAMADKIADLCRKTLSHPLLERVRQAKRLFREAPFSVSLAEKIMEGKIDLLFEEDEGWVIVDYKTDEVSGDALNERLAAYRDQGTWYARAVEKATGGIVKEVIFFFVRAGEIRTLTDFR
ncbi:MAG: UvrD-helicase domain-containing protein [Thermodesulfobacteriota bacterium]|nr:UvrD-helicase domain-containing protein [Thermodesulfobacteriota bacterium]